MAKLNLTFDFFDNESKAKEFCEMENKRYPWRKNKATYTTWSESAKSPYKYIVWYFN